MAKVREMKKRIEQAEQGTARLRRKNKEQTDQLNELNNTRARLRETLKDSQHYESGYVDCGSVPSGEGRTHTKKFTTPYLHHPPYIFFTPTTVYGLHQGDDIWFNANVTYQNATHFLFNCLPLGKSNFSSLVFDYLVIPNVHNVTLDPWKEPWN